MGFKVIQSSGYPIKAWVEGVPFAENAQEQLKNIASLPFIYKWVAAMPDVHLGITAPVGSVIATKGAVIPAAVGVDLGCGMGAVQTTLTAKDLPDKLGHIREAIEKRVPHGSASDNQKGNWGHPPLAVQHAWEDLTGTKSLEKKYPKLFRGNEVNQLGTLGGGNHFVEVCLGEDDSVWVMLHSGSRGVGNRIGTHFINLARKLMEQWYITLPDKDLAYLPLGTSHFEDYMEAVVWAQKYAMVNRILMMEATLDALREHLTPFTTVGEDVNCHHNYVSWENHYGNNVLVTRKGAVRAQEGDMGIIPGSMGAKSFIVRGKGNQESFHSCSHGAGRKMSRGEARRTITMDEHLKAVEHVECRKDEGVLDESPSAYKDIYAVMEAQEDLVEVVHTLRQVLCIKG